MNFDDLINKNKRPLKIMYRRFPYTVSDIDISNYSQYDEKIAIINLNLVPEWYIEVFP